MKSFSKENTVYEFGKFVLDPQEKTLFADGSPVRLPAKEFETLLLLVENNGRVLPKAEMMQAVWQDTFVEENNLVKNVSRLRKLLNTNGNTFIETLPKRGYRFSAEVRRTIQVADDPVIIEKHTVKRLTVSVKNEFKETPPVILLSKRNKYSRNTAFAVFGLIILTAGFTWFWRQQNQPDKNNDSGIIYLTNGSHDDNGARLTNQGQIHFSRYITNTRIESWTMNADGTNLRRANTEIKNLLNGVWSPDGNKVVFWKEGDKKTLFLADASGANEIALPITGGNMDWSPDGSQFVHQAKAHDKSEIFLYTLATGENVKLTEAGVSAADPSFSYDGKQIAFTSFRDGNAEIYVMNADGSNVLRLTNHPAFDNFPVFSPDGTQIAFQSNREDERNGVYLQNLNDSSPPRKISGLDGVTGIAPKCWSADGTQILFYNNQNGKDRIFFANVEPYTPKLILSDETADLGSPRLAPDGGQILYQARLADRRIELRLTNLAAKTTKTIFKTASNYPSDFQLAPAFSPDGRQIVFNERAGGNADIFIVNADGSNLQNLTDDPLPDRHPVFSFDGSEIIFDRHSYGLARLYRMSVDGSNQRRLTEKNGYEMTSSFSPDGLSLAFSGDRVNAESHGMDIFLLDLNNPNEEKRLTARRFHDTVPAFSPDGKKIAFVATGDGNPEIYLMNADGTGLLRLTRTNSEESAPQFSTDGKKLIFAANRNGKFAIYEIELP